jgi:type III secretory pathway component EscS
MSPTFKTLTSIAAWMLFIFGVISLIVPTVIGISTGALMGTITDIDAGKLWFYQHGLSYLIGLLMTLGFLYAVKVLKTS